jgi:hypothetical protein
MKAQTYEEKCYLASLLTSRLPIKELFDIEDPKNMHRAIFLCQERTWDVKAVTAFNSAIKLHVKSYDNAMNGSQINLSGFPSPENRDVVRTDCGVHKFGYDKRIYIKRIKACFHAVQPIGILRGKDGAPERVQLAFWIIMEKCVK